MGKPWAASRVNRRSLGINHTSMPASHSSPCSRALRALISGPSPAACCSSFLPPRSVLRRCVTDYMGAQLQLLFPPNKTRRGQKGKGKPVMKSWDVVLIAAFHHCQTVELFRRNDCKFRVWTLVSVYAGVFLFAHVGP